MVAIGIHMFAVDVERHEDNMVITVCTGDDVKQYGPNLTSRDKKAIYHSLDNKLPKRGDDIVWYAIDLKRILGTNGILQNLQGYSFESDTLRFRVWKCYDADEKRRQCSKLLAKRFATDPVTTNDATFPDEVFDVNVRASTQLMDQYARVLPLFRMKWKEIQDKSHTLEDYKLEFLPEAAKDKTRMKDGRGKRTPKRTKVDLDLDVKDFKVSRFKLLQTNWSTHIMEGTRLLAEINSGDELIAHVVEIDGKKVKFLLEGEFKVEQVVGLTIVRGGETLHAINCHLKLGVGLLTRPKVQHGGLRWCGPAFGIPMCSEQEMREKLRQERRLARRYRARRPDAVRHERWEQCSKEYGKLLARAKVQVHRDMKSDRYLRMNERQTQVVTSNAHVTIVEGPPGAGKTATLTARVLRLFECIFKRESGWILIVCPTNAACVQVVEYLAQYPSLRPFVWHYFSKLFAAYHPNLFDKLKPHKVTKNWLAMDHGIMVCTMGCVSSLFTLKRDFANRVFDLVTDETAQMWDFDSLLFLRLLPNLLRWSIFGDTAQMMPYVTRLGRQLRYFPCVNTIFTGGAVAAGDYLAPAVIKLNIDYRMLPAISIPHTAAFYSYEIIPARPASTSCHTGLYLERLPHRHELPPDCSLAIYEVKRALEIYTQIHERQHVDQGGNPYSYLILTPYHETKLRLESSIAAQGITDPQLRVSTIDSEQGSEADVVILTTSRHKIVDLLICPFRGNVATSRAKDILVIMAHSQVVLGVTGDPRRLRFWGMMALHAEPFSPNDREAVLLLGKINRRYHEHLQEAQGISTDSRVTGQTRQMIRARSVLAAGNVANVDRVCLLRDLVLRPKMSHNKNIHMVLYYHLFTCRHALFEEALRLFERIYARDERNDAIAELLGFNLHAEPSELARYFTHCAYDKSIYHNKRR